jgi:hypothetical protein
MSRSAAIPLSFLLAASAAVPVLAQEAGRVEFVAGEAVVRARDGAPRPAVRGTAVGQGETVETREGRVQLRMEDGAYVSLQPRTELRFDEYVPARAGVEERGFMRLVRGGLRTITGSIGRVNRSAYRVTTPTATIGIRGTQFALFEGDGTRVNVADGIIQLCTTGGCLDVFAGQSGFAPGPTARPTLAFSPARLPPVASVQPVLPVVLSEARRDDGAAIVFSQPLAPAALPVVPLASGAGGIGMATVEGGVFSGGLLGGTVTFHPDGALAQFIDGGTPANNFTAGVSSDFGADGIIAWGRWTSGDRAGVPQLTMNYAANLSANAVTAASIVRGYVAFASTAPTITSAGSIVATGAPNSVTGTMAVNFPNLTGGGSLTYVLNVPVAGQTFNINGSATQFVGTAFLGSASTITSTGAGCTPSCTGNMPFANALQGFFTGANAERAGANYGFASQLGQVTGAVVFR